MDFHGPNFAIALTAAMMAMPFIAWVLVTAIRAKHGYPLSDDHGLTVQMGDPEAARKVARLTSENDKLHGQVSRLEERIAVLERIATDAPSRLTAEIERLR